MAYYKKFDEASTARHLELLKIPAVKGSGVNPSATIGPEAEKPLRMVLDTDCYNEVDDQYAIAYALLSPDRVKVEAIYAAPFTNHRAKTAKEGMELSYKELLEICKRMNINPEGFAFKGSDRYLGADLDSPVDSPAVRDLIDRAMNGGDDPLYVVAIGAITNVASAILLEPKIIDKIVLIWLGANATFWPSMSEFNSNQDVPAVNYCLSCGVPFIQIPCNGVTSHLTTTLPELKEFIGNRSDLCDLLIDRFTAYSSNHYGYAKALWDVGAIAYLVDPTTFSAHLEPTFNIEPEKPFNIIKNAAEHKFVTLVRCDRTKIFRDMFKKLSAFEG